MGVIKLTILLNCFQTISNEYTKISHCIIILAGCYLTLINLFLCKNTCLDFYLTSCYFQAQWYHQGGESLGRPWQRGDVVGCLVDIAERTMMVTLNGEVLFNDRGSELAAKDFDIRDGLE